MIAKLSGWLYLGARIIALIFVAGVISDIVMNGTFIPQRLLAALVIWTIGWAAKFVLAGEYSESTAWNWLKSRFWDVESMVLGAPSCTSSTTRYHGCGGSLGSCGANTKSQSSCCC